MNSQHGLSVTYPKVGSTKYLMGEEKDTKSGGYGKESGDFNMIKIYCMQFSKKLIRMRKIRQKSIANCGIFSVYGFKNFYL